MRFRFKPVHAFEDVTANFEQLEQSTSGLLPAGAIMPYAGATAPGGYLLCDGSVYDPTKYTALFQAIGTTWGGTSASPLLPDFRGRAPLGAGTGTATGATAHALGPGPTSGAGGEETHLLTGPESGVAAHGHGTGTAQAFATTTGVAQVASGTAFAAINSNVATTANAGPTNAASAHNIMGPVAVVNFLIKV